MRFNGHYHLFGPRSNFGVGAHGRVTQVTLRVKGMKLSLWLSGWHADATVQEMAHRWNKDASAVEFQLGTTQRDSWAFEPTGEPIKLA